MKKILVSTTFILLALTPFLFGNHAFYQNFNGAHNGAEESNGNTSRLRNCTVIEDAILMMDKKNRSQKEESNEDEEIDNWKDLDFVTILSQRPTSEDNKILSQPNPFKNFASLELKTPIQKGKVKLFDDLGNVVFLKNFKGKQFEIQRDGLQSGIYFYTITDNDQAINAGKIIIN